LVFYNADGMCLLRGTTGYLNMRLICIFKGLITEMSLGFRRILTAILLIAVVTTVIPMVTFQETVNAAHFVRTEELV